MNTTARSLLLASLVALAAFTAPAAAAADASLEADPAAPGETATHTATITVGDTATGSLNGFAVDYNNSGANVSNVGQDDVVTVGIDRGDDAAGDTIDVNISDDLSSVKTSNEGTYLNVRFGGSYSLNASDEVVVVYDDVQNPAEEGDYPVTLDVNPQSSGGSADATLTTDAGLLGGSETETATPTPTPTEEETATPTEEETATPTEEESQSQDTATATPADTTSDSSDDADSADSSDDADSSDSSDSSDSQSTPTEGNGPGFGVTAALVALAGAAIAALRR